MKAHNLTVCIPTERCKKGCPYCISRMTPDTIGENFTGDRVRLAIRYAKTAGAQSVLITSRGEPFSNPSTIVGVLDEATREGLPTEVQTNGECLPGLMEAFHGLSTVAVSIDSRGQVSRQDKLFHKVVSCSMVLRWTVVLTDETMMWDADHWVRIAREKKVRQLSFRKLTAPPECRNEWIEQNTKTNRAWMADLNESLIRWKPKPRLIRTLPFGAVHPEVYDVGGISLTYFPYCVDDRKPEEDVRSLILREDGHVYTDWDSLASILF